MTQANSPLARFLAECEADLRVTVSWHNGSARDQVTFTRDALPPAIFRCPEPRCTHTGFSLADALSRARAATRYRKINLTTSVECLGTILLDNAPLRPCGKHFDIQIQATLLPPAPPPT